MIVLLPFVTFLADTVGNVRFAWEDDRMMAMARIATRR